MTRVVASAAMPFDLGPILGSIELVAPDQGSMSRAELLEALAGADALISLLDVAVDAELLDAGPALRIVANFAVGTDNIDLEAATRRRVAVTNTPGVLTEATADFTWALLLASARRVVEGDVLARSGRWTGWEPGLLLGATVAGQTLGIVGMGRIGRAVARRAAGFSMKVVYTGPRPSDEADALGARYTSLSELAAISDFVALHCPLSPETTHLVDRELLRQMKPTATLINTARGACVDDAALVDALAAGEIAGAGLDVFTDEPVIHPGLVASPRVVLAPHAASATVEARSQMASICAHAVRAIMDGRRPETLLNPEVLAS